MANLACVHIPASDRLGTLCIGVTSDLLARLHQHRTGTTPGFTTRYGVHRLVRYEFLSDRPAAIAREKQSRRWHRDWKVNLIERDDPHWEDLAPGPGLEPLTARVRPDGP